MSKAQRYDVAVIGAGFAGAILARILRRRGLSVLLVEKGHHPRFALGESTTPLANLALERLAARYGLPDLHHLSTHGRWQNHLPQLRVGLKRGFTFYQHHPGQPYKNNVTNEARLLVAASPDAHNADTHWLRADVDHHLVRAAVAAGVDYRDRTTLDGLEASDKALALAGHRDGTRCAFRATRLVDASGPNGFLARCLPIADRTSDVPVRSGLLYSQFRNVKSFTAIAQAAGARLNKGPYPDEKAAVHHLLREGWLYALPFDHGVTSAGILLRTLPRGLEEETLRRDPAAAWKACLAPYPTLAATFAQAEAVMPMRYRPRIQHRLARAAGESWLALPHTFAFFEPLFSTGIAWSLLGVERVADVILREDSLLNENSEPDRYQALLNREADQIATLIEAAYLAMDDFALFTAVSFLYFALVSYEEVRQRLHPAPPGDLPHAWVSFLGANDTALRTLLTDARDRLRQPATRQTFAQWAQTAIAPRNIAGLADPARHNLYPLDLELLIERAHLLGMSRQALQAALPQLRGDPLLYP